ncbi:metalloregulator ArsR/SmtB family transcription factor [Thorsellia kenyensis]|uniref:Metalloregulator ArsR/SmtB family transcription factor n=1 Tax=Thorsellia kenyensis TaxID=1549888 RepID=A0ABV6CCS6_9GAMM
MHKDRIHKEKAMKTLSEVMTPEQTKLHEAASYAVDVLRALANQDRLLILCFLSQGEANVSNLENKLGIRQPTLSQQLGILRKQKLVETRREGKQIFYRIDDKRVLSLLQTMYSLFCPEELKEE